MNNILFRTEIYFESINKYGEELCGDKVEVIKTPEKTIFVMADGLGSGVKANILATLTTKIAATMLKEGASVEETVKTIIATLPVCKVRKIAYSTFTIIEISSNGKCSIIEYDNPPVFFLREGRVQKIPVNFLEIEGKILKESFLELKKEDLLVVVSDGIVHAGIGGILNLGWQWENIADYLEKVIKNETKPAEIVKLLITITNNFYLDKAGDDATCAAIKVVAPNRLTVIAGPPANPEDDLKAVKCFMENKGKKVVCGGTTAQIVAKILNKQLVTSTEFIDPQVPPAAHIDGIDLVTEGVLTLAKTLEKLNNIAEGKIQLKELIHHKKMDAATRLALMLYEATDITFIIGSAVNPAHQNPDFPKNLSIKQNVIGSIINILKKMGKFVDVKNF